jgi:hypothetical protein
MEDLIISLQEFTWIPTIIGLIVVGLRLRRFDRTRKPVLKSYVEGYSIGEFAIGCVVLIRAMSGEYTVALLWLFLLAGMEFQKRKWIAQLQLQTDGVSTCHESVQQIGDKR